MYVCSALDQHFWTGGMTSWKDPAENRRKRKRKHNFAENRRRDIIIFVAYFRI